MNYIGLLISFVFSLKRSFASRYFYKDYDFQVKNLLGVSFYNFGSQPVMINDFELRAYDVNRGPDVYILDTLPYVYEDNLVIKIRFSGSNISQNKVYASYSALKKT